MTMDRLASNNSKRNRDGTLNMARMMKLQLDTEQINDENDPSSGYHQASSVASPSHTFRQDGISIGCDYLRINGQTYVRDLLHCKNIRVHEMIGHGAFSTVYRATWYTSNCLVPTRVDSAEEDVVHENRSVLESFDSQSIDVAIKIWTLSDLSSEQRQKMLLQELRTLSALVPSASTVSLVQLYGAFKNPAPSHSITLVLEYMNKGSLEEFIRREEKYTTENTHGLSEFIIASILYQILLALFVLHDHRILHRDLKPANVLLHSNGLVKLCDFGIATPSVRIHHEDMSILNRTVLGTTKFMSPERLRALPYGRSSDIWSFGCIIFQCLTRTCLWYNVHSMVDLLVTMEEMTIADLLRQLHHVRFPNASKLVDHSTATSSSKISEGLQEILIGCLQLDQAKRIPARLLLQSPWFSQDQHIAHHDDAIQRMRRYFANPTK